MSTFQNKLKKRFQKNKIKGFDWLSVLSLINKLSVNIPEDLWEFISFYNDNNLIPKLLKKHKLLHTKKKIFKCSN